MKRHYSTTEGAQAEKVEKVEKVEKETGKAPTAADETAAAEEEEEVPAGNAVEKTAEAVMEETRLRADETAAAEEEEEVSPPLV